MLFNTYPRTDSSPKAIPESDFAFLNRSARPDIEKVRQLIERLVLQYPEVERAELVARIQSGNDTHFKSAVFELLLYVFLITLGFKLQLHPKLGNGSNSRPDFHVVTPDGGEFFLEAVLASVKDDVDPAAKARIGTTLNALTMASHPCFMIAVESEGVPVTQPSGVRLRKEVLEWLDSLDPNEVQTQIDNADLFAAPTHYWSHEDWQLLLRPIPITSDRRGKTTTLIAVIHRSARVIDKWSRLRDAIKFKGAKYGNLDKPLLVAVNFDAFNLHRIDEMQALFGQEQLVFNTADVKQRPKFCRAPNGAWHGRFGPQATRVSGAWIFNDLSPYTIASRRHTVYFNPWAANALPKALTQMPHAIVQDGKIQREEGIALPKVLGLSKDWLE